ncbi:MAG: NADP-dependent phosphogluconate dehydrogenase [Myxococcota bacterium]
MMTTNRCDMGVVGLGVMGASLAQNMADKGFTIALYNRTRDKTDELVASYANKGRLVPTYDLKGLVDSLASPRKILMMLKAGSPVDDMIAALSPLLSPGDVLIDGGNEFFPNTERRAEEAKKRGLNYVGMGVSGGEEGARHGPSMMPGGAKEAWDVVSPILTKIAAQVSDGPCVTHIGKGGSGHYVKMVHNGIEYGDMQLISEIYDLLKSVGGLDNAGLAQTFSDWNKTELESFLIEITARVFKQKDPETNKALVDVILDRASMKGTGSWTVEQGAQLGAPIPTIASAVDARVLSSLREARLEGASRLKGPRPMLTAPELIKSLVADARAALYAAKVVSYAQGMSMLRQASDKYGWGLDLVEIARIWKGGCIIRARLLGDIQAALKEPRAREGNLLFSTAFSAALAEREGAWRRTITRAIEAGIAVPALSTSLAYYDTLRRERVPANLIQAQRDLFGAHTYERIDRPGSFHTEWGS